MAKQAEQACKELLRQVVRMFYETEHMVVMDALCYHGALTLPDVIQILDAGKNSKAVGKIVGRLKEAGLCTVYTQRIKRDGANKETTREYYYIDYRHAVDSCKYRVHKVHDRVSKEAKPTAEKAEFKCPRCRSQFTMMDVIDRPDPEGRSSGFLCARCNYPLDEIDQGGQADVGAEDVTAKFNKMFRPITKLLEDLDKHNIPAVEGDYVVKTKIDLPRDKTIDPGTKVEIVEDSISRPTAVKGIDTGPEKITIQIGSSAEVNEKQRAEEKARQEQNAVRNQLPVWTTQSTVVKGSNGASSTAIKQESNGTDSPAIKTEAGGAQSATQDLDGIFAQIEAERLAKEKEEEDDEDDDDDDEFEDVAVGAPSAQPAAKRVKLELPASGAPTASATPSNAATPAVSTGDGGEESEEDEFEDVN